MNEDHALERLARAGASLAGAMCGTDRQALVAAIAEVELELSALPSFGDREGSRALQSLSAALDSAAQRVNMLSATTSDRRPLAERFGMRHARRVA